MQTNENLKKINTRLEGAFKPFRHVAEFWDYEQKLRFKVFDKNDQCIIEMTQIPVRELIDESFLEDLIEHTRAEIHSQRPDFP